MDYLCSVAILAVLLHVYLIANSLGASTRTRVFRILDPSLIVPNTTPFVSETSRSRVQCAMSCHHSLSCVTFSYDDATGACVKSSRVVPGTGLDVYESDDCPISKGYTLHLPNNYCLKYYSTAATHPEAVGTCAKDAAHLLLVENAEMHSSIKTLLTYVAVAPVFVDGIDLKGNKTFVSWKGKPVPYIKWKTGDPDQAGEDCIRLTGDISELYDFADGSCQHAYKFICQKEY